MEKYRFKWFALIGISLLAFTSFLDFTIVNTAIPFIQKDLEASVLQLQWVSNIFAIALSCSMIAVGKLADCWGKKKLFYSGLAIFAVAALGAGFSSTIPSLVAFRGAQGLGASMVFITAAALLSDAFPKNDQPRAISIYSGITGLGLVIGPFLGGMLVGLLDWRWVFWINLPLIFFGVIFCFFSLRHVQPAIHRVKIDWLSLCLLIAGLGSLTYGITNLSWIALVGLAILVFLFAMDLKKARPLLALRELFDNKLTFLALLSCCTAGFSSYVFLFFDPLYLENVRGESAFAIGWIISVIPAAQVVISFIFESLVKKMGLANLLIVSILTGTAAAALHGTITAESPILWILIPFFLLGVPWGLSNAGQVATVHQTVASHKVGETIGTIMTVWNVAGAIFLSISTVIFHLAATSFMTGFRAMVLVNFLVMVLISVTALCVRKKLPTS
jgi:MFS family permease